MKKCLLLFVAILVLLLVVSCSAASSTDNDKAGTKTADTGNETPAPENTTMTTETTEQTETPEPTETAQPADEKGENVETYGIKYFVPAAFTDVSDDEGKCYSIDYKDFIFVVKTGATTLDELSEDSLRLWIKETFYDDCIVSYGDHHVDKIGDHDMVCMSAVVLFADEETFLFDIHILFDDYTVRVLSLSPLEGGNEDAVREFTESIDIA